MWAFIAKGCIIVWVGIDNPGRAKAEIADVAEAMLRHRVALCLWIALVLCVTAAVLNGIKPQYGAATQLLLEQPARAGDGIDIVRQFHQLTLDDAQAQTQLHVILSEGLLRKVFESLDLAHSPELAPDSDGPMEQVARWFDSTGVAEASVGPEPAFARFRSKMRARRIGLSYVIEIDYWAQDAAQARRVVNAVAAAYLRDRIETVAPDVTLGQSLVTRRGIRVQAEKRMATSAMGLGTIPETDFPDAAVRLLGATSQLAGKAFPRPFPVFAMALCFAALSGMLGVALLNQLRQGGA